MKRKKIIYVIIILIVTLSSCILTRYITSGLLTNQVFSFSNNELSNDISDYYILANRGIGKKHLSSKDICIVFIDSVKTRSQIANVLTEILKCDPKVIGLDVQFPHAGNEDEDSLLRDAVLQCDNKLIQTFTGHSLNDGRLFDVIDSSFFVTAIEPLSFGFDNITSMETNPRNRKLLLQAKYGNQEFSSFAKLLYEKYSGEQIKDNTIRVLYNPTRFNPIRDVNSINKYADLLKDKIVLIGDEDNYSDRHLTPIGIIPGVEIHAHVIDSLLHIGDNREMPIIVTWIIAFFTSLLFSIILLISKLYWGGYDNLIIRLLQIVFLIICLITCSIIYINHNYLILFSPIIGVIALSSFTFDIIYGLFSLFKLI